MTPFTFPEFWSYPPYFTIQPATETKEKQKELWRILILEYCRHYHIFRIGIDSPQEFAPFANPSINRRLSRDAKLVLLDDLERHGNGEWLDGKSKTNFLVFWKTLKDWAEDLYSFASSKGLKESVVTLTELQSDFATYRGREFEGIPQEILVRIIKNLEGQGKAKLFKGSASDEEGVKFF